MTASIVLALHDRIQSLTLPQPFKNRGFQPYCAGDLEELYRLATDTNYQNYLMDPNFGKPENPDITSAIRVRDIISSRSDKDQVRLLAISGNEDIVDSCLSAGIDAKVKPLTIQELCAFFKRD